MTKVLIALAVFAVAIGIIGGWAKAKQQAAGGSYRRKRELLNPGEVTLYKRLCEAAPSFIVFAQVGMSQILEIDTRKPGGYQQLNRVGRKVLDFVLVKQEDTSIVLAVEFNGKTHNRADRRKSDDTKRNALEEAGIPLLVFTPKDLPDVEGLRRAIAGAIVKSSQNNPHR